MSKKVKITVQFISYLSERKKWKWKKSHQWARRTSLYSRTICDHNMPDFLDSEKLWSFYSQRFWLKAVKITWSGLYIIATSACPRQVSHNFGCFLISQATSSTMQSTIVTLFEFSLFHDMNITYIILYKYII